jgi:pimeloyl-ACP methyl ester carboxylesterase
MRYLYLHGFASGARSAKGRQMAEAFAARGHALALVDWNRPDFARLTTTAALDAIDEAAGDAGPLTLIGSSMGGYLATLWTQLHPERVARLVLLCPGFDLLSRWPQMLGEEAWARWQQDGALEFHDSAGVLTPVHFGFIEDARRWPTYPDVSCPTLILHGIQDEVVPIASSRVWAASRPHARLVELDADHRMLEAAPRIIDETLAFLGIA